MSTNPEEIHAAKKAIEAHVTPAHLLGNPWYDHESKEWQANVAISPSGPLVLLGFSLRPKK